jgi:hypothetical protein
VASSHTYALPWMPPAGAAIVNSSFSSSGSTPIADSALAAGPADQIAAKAQITRISSHADRHYTLRYLMIANTGSAANLVMVTVPGFACSGGFWLAAAAW